MRRNTSMAILIMILAGGCTTLVPTALPTETPFPTLQPTPDLWDPFALNMRMGRGVNLGNALEAPNEGDWGVTLYEEYFALIKRGGIRLCAHPDPLVGARSHRGAVHD